MTTLGSQDRKLSFEQAIKEQKNVSLVVNTHSRRGRILYKMAQEALLKRGYHLEKCYSVNDPTRLPEVVKHAIEDGCKFLVVGGGDGTLSSIVDHMAYEDIVLGVLPLGTGNGFARTLGLPLDLDGAIDTLVNGKVIDIDLGVANGDYFANIISIGFNAHVVHNTSNALKRTFGVFAYVIQGMKEIGQNRPFVVDITCDGVTSEHVTRQVIIANGAFYGVSRICEDARVDNEELIVCMLDSVKKWDIVRFWFALMRGTLPCHESVKMFSCSKIHCHATPPKQVDVDGEVTFTTPLDVELAPKALMVMVPQDFVRSKVLKKKAK